MKKFLFIFLLLFNTKVKAITFYSDYSSFSDYSSEYVESNELTNVEIIENKKYFINKNVENDNGKYIDYDSYKTFSSEIVSIKPEEKENRVITTYDNSYYLDIPKVNYIKLSNTTDITVESIPLYLKDNSYFYEFRCNDCFFGSYIHLSETDYYMINLGGYYSVNDIMLAFKFNGEKKDFGLDIEYISDDLTFYKERISLDVVKEDISYVHTYTADFLLKDKLVKNEKNSSKDQLYIEDIKYSYVDTIYKRYDVVKEYVNYETDSYDIEKLYRYQKRDKIEIKDNIILTNYKYDLDDYIKCTNKYTVTDNIDIKNNGVYSILIKFLGKEIKRSVVVNIKDNEIRLDNENKLEELKNIINEKEYEIKTILEEKEKVNEEVNTLNHIINSKKETTKEVIVSKGNSKRIIIIFFIIILLLLLLHMFRKKTS